MTSPPWYQLNLRRCLRESGREDADTFCCELDQMFAELSLRRIQTRGDLWLLADRLCDLAVPILDRGELLMPATLANLVDLAAIYGTTHDLGPHRTGEVIRGMLSLARQAQAPLSSTD